MLLSLEKTWRKLNPYLPTERSQSGKAPYCIITATRYSGKGKSIETVKSSVVNRDLGWNDRQSTMDLQAL